MPARRNLRLDALAVAAIVVATVVAFAPALRADFINWDDDKNITQNEEFRGLSWRHLRWMFTTFHMGPYQPLSWLSLAIDYTIGGLHPFGYHLTNVLIHALTAAAFFFLARALLILARPDREETGIRLASAVAALLFAIHPMRVESVAWVTERRDVLSGLFFVVTMLAYLRYAAPGSSSKPARPGRFYALTLVALVLALLSKASTMVAPPLMLVIDAWPLRRWNAANPGGRPAQLLVEKIPFFTISAIFAALAFHGQSAHAGAMKSIAQHGFLERIAQSSYGLMYYPVRMVLPVGLLPVYELPDPFQAFRPIFIASAVGVACLVLVLWLLRRRFPSGLTAWICCALAVAPVLGLVQSGPQLVADRYSYLSSMPLAILAAGAFLSAWRGAEVRWTAGSAAIAVLIALGVLTWRYSDRWRDSERLWTYARDRNPRSISASNNLGLYLEQQGRSGEAEAEYRRAIALQPRNNEIARVHNNLALLLDSLGRPAEAIENYEAALAVEWKYPIAHANLAELLVRQGKTSEALAHYREAVSIAPQYMNAQAALVLTLHQVGLTDEAVAHLRGLLESEGESAEELFLLGYVLSQSGNLDEATIHLEKALALKPDFAQAQLVLERIRGARGAPAVGENRRGAEAAEEQRE